MIAKGNQHNNGVKLADYLLKGKDHERTELWEFRGFGTNTNLKDGFRDVHILAGATKAQQPFFHVQVRLPEGEKLKREQWQQTANRIERMLGLTGQPRAIVFHIDERTGDEHMHVAWSRIDADTLKARPLAFFKDRLKRISRELEKEFDLTQVKSHRDSPIKYAATKPEQEQARRLGIDPEHVRNMIRTCWDQSDCGRSFEASLADQGLMLTQGDRRSFVVVDQAGGLHALGKRILDANKAQIDERLADLDPNHLPHVEQARELLREPFDRQERKPQSETWDRDRANREWEDAVAKAAIEKEARGGATAGREQGPQPDITELLKRELAEIDKLLYGGLTPDEQKRQLEDLDMFLAEELYERWKKYPNHYRTQWQHQIPSGVAAEIEKLAAAEAEREYARHEPAREETAWHDAVARAAIAKEDREREFVEPRPVPASPARIEAQGDQQKKEQQPEPAPAPKVKGAAAHLREALQHSSSPEEFILALDELEIMLACTTREEAHRTRAQASFARQFGNFAPEYREGEVVAVTYQGHVYQLSERNTGKSREDMEAFLEPLDRRHLLGVEATKEIQNRARHDRNEVHWPTTPEPHERQVSATGLKIHDAPATSPALHFHDAARQTHEPQAAPAMPADLKGIAAEIWTAYNSRTVDREWQRENADGTKEIMRDRITLQGGRDPHKFAQALDQRGLILARATKEEAEQSRKDAEHSKEFGESYRPVYQEGEFVVIDRRGEASKLGQRTTGHAAREVQAFLNKAEWKALPGIEAGRQAMKTRADERLSDARDRAAAWDATRLKNATRKRGGRGEGRVGQPTAPDLARASGRAIGGALGALGKLADGFSLDALTPKEKYEAAKFRHTKEREAEEGFDAMKYLEQRAEARQEHQQREAERERERDRDR